eukprot:Nk52_evm4s348 gene=Nk52_evmTU4s348
MSGIQPIHRIPQAIQGGGGGGRGGKTRTLLIVVLIVACMVLFMHNTRKNLEQLRQGGGSLTDEVKDTKGENQLNALLGEPYEDAEEQVDALRQFVRMNPFVGEERSITEPKKREEAARRTSRRVRREFLGCDMWYISTRAPYFSDMVGVNAASRDTELSRANVDCMRGRVRRMQNKGATWMKSGLDKSNDDITPKKKENASLPSDAEKEAERQRIQAKEDMIMKAVLEEDNDQPWFFGMAYDSVSDEELAAGEEANTKERIREGAGVVLLQTMYYPYDVFAEADKLYEDAPVGISERAEQLKEALESSGEGETSFSSSSSSFSSSVPPLRGSTGENYFKYSGARITSRVMYGHGVLNIGVSVPVFDRNQREHTPPKSTLYPDPLLPIDYVQLAKDVQERDGQIVSVSLWQPDKAPDITTNQVSGKQGKNAEAKEMNGEIGQYIFPCSGQVTFARVSYSRVNPFHVSENEVGDSRLPFMKDHKGGRVTLLKVETIYDAPIGDEELCTKAVVKDYFHRDFELNESEVSVPKGVYSSGDTHGVFYPASYSDEDRSAFFLKGFCRFRAWVAIPVRPMTYEEQMGGTEYVMYPFMKVPRFKQHLVDLEIHSVWDEAGITVGFNDESPHFVFKADQARKEDIPRATESYHQINLRNTVYVPMDKHSLVFFSGVDALKVHKQYEERVKADMYKKLIEHRNEHPQTWVDANILRQHRLQKQRIGKYQTENDDIVDITFIRRHVGMRINYIEHSRQCAKKDLYIGLVVDEPSAVEHFQESLRTYCKKKEIACKIFVKSIPQDEDSVGEQRDPSRSVDVSKLFSPSIDPKNASKYEETYGRHFKYDNLGKSELSMFDPKVSNTVWEFFVPNRAAPLLPSGDPTCQIVFYPSKGKADDFGDVNHLVYASWWPNDYLDAIFELGLRKIGLIFSGSYSTLDEWSMLSRQYMECQLQRESPKASESPIVFPKVDPESFIKTLKEMSVAIEKAKTFTEISWARFKAMAHVPCAGYIGKLFDEGRIYPSGGLISGAKRSDFEDFIAVGNLGEGFGICDLPEYPYSHYRRGPNVEIVRPHTSTSQGNFDNVRLNDDVSLASLFVMTSGKVDFRLKQISIENKIGLNTLCVSSKSQSFVVFEAMLVSSSDLISDGVVLKGKSGPFFRVHYHCGSSLVGPYLFSESGYSSGEERPENGSVRKEENKNYSNINVVTHSESLKENDPQSDGKEPPNMDVPLKAHKQGTYHSNESQGLYSCRTDEDSIGIRYEMYSSEYRYETLGSMAQPSDILHFGESSQIYYDKLVSPDSAMESFSLGMFGDITFLECVDFEETVDNRCMFSDYIGLISPDSMTPSYMLQDAVAENRRYEEELVRSRYIRHIVRHGFANRYVRDGTQFRAGSGKTMKSLVFQSIVKGMSFELSHIRADSGYNKEDFGSGTSYRQCAQVLEVEKAPITEPEHGFKGFHLMTQSKQSKIFFGDVISSPTGSGGFVDWEKKEKMFLIRGPRTGKEDEETLLEMCKPFEFASTWRMGLGQVSFEATDMGNSPTSSLELDFYWAEDPPKMDEYYDRLDAYRSGTLFQKEKPMHPSMGYSNLHLYRGDYLLSSDSYFPILFHRDTVDENGRWIGWESMRDMVNQLVLQVNVDFVSQTMGATIYHAPLVEGASSIPPIVSSKKQYGKLMEAKDKFKYKTILTMPTEAEFCYPKDAVEKKTGSHSHDGHIEHEEQFPKRASCKRSKVRTKNIPVLVKVTFCIGDRLMIEMVGTNKEMVGDFEKSVYLESNILPVRITLPPTFSETLPRHAFLRVYDKTCISAYETKKGSQNTHNSASQDQKESDQSEPFENSSLVRIRDFKALPANVDSCLLMDGSEGSGPESTDERLSMRRMLTSNLNPFGYQVASPLWFGFFKDFKSSIIDFKNFLGWGGKVFGKSYPFPTTVGIFTSLDKANEKHRQFISKFALSNVSPTVMRRLGSFSSAKKLGRPIEHESYNTNPGTGSSGKSESHPNIVFPSLEEIFSDDKREMNEKLGIDYRRALMVDKSRLYSQTKLFNARARFSVGLNIDPGALRKMRIEYQLKGVRYHILFSAALIPEDEYIREISGGNKGRDYYTHYNQYANYVYWRNGPAVAYEIVYDAFTHLVFSRTGAFMRFDEYLDTVFLKNSKPYKNVDINDDSSNSFEEAKSGKRSISRFCNANTYPALWKSNGANVVSAGPGESRQEVFREFVCQNPNAIKLSTTRTDMKEMREVLQRKEELIRALGYDVLYETRLYEANKDVLVKLSEGLEVQEELNLNPLDATKLSTHSYTTSGGAFNDNSLTMKDLQTELIFAALFDESSLPKTRLFYDHVKEIDISVCNLDCEFSISPRSNTTFGILDEDDENKYNIHSAHLNMGNWRGYQWGKKFRVLEFEVHYDGVVASILNLRVEEDACNADGSTDVLEGTFDREREMKKVDNKRPKLFPEVNTTLDAFTPKSVPRKILSTLFLDKASLEHRIERGEGYIKIQDEPNLLHYVDQNTLKGASYFALHIPESQLKEMKDPGQYTLQAVIYSKVWNFKQNSFRPNEYNKFRYYPFVNFDWNLYTDQGRPEVLAFVDVEMNVRDGHILEEAEVTLRVEYEDKYEFETLFPINDPSRYALDMLDEVELYRDRKHFITNTSNTFYMQQFFTGALDVDEKGQQKKRKTQYVKENARHFCGLRTQWKNVAMRDTKGQYATFECKQKVTLRDNPFKSPTDTKQKLRDLWVFLDINCNKHYFQKKRTFRSSTSIRDWQVSNDVIRTDNPFAMDVLDLQSTDVDSHPVVDEFFQNPNNTDRYMIQGPALKRNVASFALTMPSRYSSESSRVMELMLKVPTPTKKAEENHVDDSSANVQRMPFVNVFMLSSQISTCRDDNDILGRSRGAMERTKRATKTDAMSSPTSEHPPIQTFSDFYNGVLDVWEDADANEPFIVASTTETWFAMVNGTKAEYMSKITPTKPCERLVAGKKYQYIYFGRKKLLFKCTCESLQDIHFSRSSLLKLITTPKTPENSAPCDQIDHIEGREWKQPDQASDCSDGLGCFHKYVPDDSKVVRVTSYSDAECTMSRVAPRPIDDHETGIYDANSRYTLLYDSQCNGPFSSKGIGDYFVQIKTDDDVPLSIQIHQYMLQATHAYCLERTNLKAIITVQKNVCGSESQKAKGMTKTVEYSPTIPDEFKNNIDTNYPFVVRGMRALHYNDEGLVYKTKETLEPSCTVYSRDFVYVWWPLTGEMYTCPCTELDNGSILQIKLLDVLIKTDSKCTKVPDANGTSKLPSDRKFSQIEHPTEDDLKVPYVYKTSSVLDEDTGSFDIHVEWFSRTEAEGRLCKGPSVDKRVYSFNRCTSNVVFNQKARGDIKYLAYRGDQPGFPTVCMHTQLHEVGLFKNGLCSYVTRSSQIHFEPLWNEPEDFRDSTEQVRLMKNKYSDNPFVVRYAVKHYMNDKDFLKFEQRAEGRPVPVCEEAAQKSNGDPVTKPTAYVWWPRTQEMYQCECEYIEMGEMSSSKLKDALDVDLYCKKRLKIEDQDDIGTIQELEHSTKAGGSEAFDTVTLSNVDLLSHGDLPLTERMRMRRKLYSNVFCLNVFEQFEDFKVMNCHSNWRIIKTSTGFDKYIYANGESGFESHCTTTRLMEIVSVKKWPVCGAVSAVYSDIEYFANMPKDFELNKSERETLLPFVARYEVTQMFNHQRLAYESKMISLSLSCAHPDTRLKVYTPEKDILYKCPCKNIANGNLEGNMLKRILQLTPQVCDIDESYSKQIFVWQKYDNANSVRYIRLHSEIDKDGNSKTDFLRELYNLKLEEYSDEQCMVPYEPPNPKAGDMIFAPHSFNNFSCSEDYEVFAPADILPKSVLYMQQDLHILKVVHYSGPLDGSTTALPDDDARKRGKALCETRNQADVRVWQAKILDVCVPVTTERILAQSDQIERVNAKPRFSMKFYYGGEPSSLREDNERFLPFVVRYKEKVWVNEYRQIFKKEGSSVDVICPVTADDSKTADSMRILVWYPKIWKLYNCSCDAIKQGNMAASELETVLRNGNSFYCPIANDTQLQPIPRGNRDPVEFRKVTNVGEKDGINKKMKTTIYTDKNCRRESQAKLPFVMSVNRCYSNWYVLYLAKEFLIDVHEGGPVGFIGACRSTTLLAKRKFGVGVCGSHKVPYRQVTKFFALEPPVFTRQRLNVVQPFVARYRVERWYNSEMLEVKADGEPVHSCDRGSENIAIVYDATATKSKVLVCPCKSIYNSYSGLVTTPCSFFTPHEAKDLSTSRHLIPYIRYNKQNAPPGTAYTNIIEQRQYLDEKCTRPVLHPDGREVVSKALVSNYKCVNNVMTTFTDEYVRNFLFYDVNSCKQDRDVYIRKSSSTLLDQCRSEFHMGNMVVSYYNGLPVAAGYSQATPAVPPEYLDDVRMNDPFSKPFVVRYHKETFFVKDKHDEPFLIRSRVVPVCEDSFGKAMVYFPKRQSLYQCPCDEINYGRILSRYLVPLLEGTAQKKQLCTLISQDSMRFSRKDFMQLRYTRVSINGTNNVRFSLFNRDDSMCKVNSSDFFDIPLEKCTGNSFPVLKDTHTSHTVSGPVVSQDHSRVFVYHFRGRPLGFEESVIGADCRLSEQFALSVYSLGKCGTEDDVVENQNREYWPFVPREFYINNRAPVSDEDDPSVHDPYIVRYSTRRSFTNITHRQVSTQGWPVSDCSNTSLSWKATVFVPSTSMASAKSYHCNCRFLQGGTIERSSLRPLISNPEVCTPASYIRYTQDKLDKDLMGLQNTFYAYSVDTDSNMAVRTNYSDGHCTQKKFGQDLNVIEDRFPLKQCLTFRSEENPDVVNSMFFYDQDQMVLTYIFDSDLCANGTLREIRSYSLGECSSDFMPRENVFDLLPTAPKAFSASVLAKPFLVRFQIEKWFNERGEVARVVLLRPYAHDCDPEVSHTTMRKAPRLGLVYDQLSDRYFGCPCEYVLDPTTKENGVDIKHCSPSFLSQVWYNPFFARENMELVEQHRSKQTRSTESTDNYVRFKVNVHNDLEGEYFGPDSSCTGTPSTRMLQLCAEKNIWDANTGTGGKFEYTVGNNIFVATNYDTIEECKNKDSHDWLYKMRIPLKKCVMQRMPPVPTEIKNTRSIFVADRSNVMWYIFRTNETCENAESGLEHAQDDTVLIVNLWSFENKNVVCRKKNSLVPFWFSYEKGYQKGKTFFYKIIDSQPSANLKEVFTVRVYKTADDCKADKDVALEKRVRTNVCSSHLLDYFKYEFDVVKGAKPMVVKYNYTSLEDCVAAETNGAPSDKGLVLGECITSDLPGAGPENPDMHHMHLVDESNGLFSIEYYASEDDCWFRRGLARVAVEKYYLGVCAAHFYQPITVGDLRLKTLQSFAESYEDLPEYLKQMPWNYIGVLRFETTTYENENFDVFRGITVQNDVCSGKAVNVYDPASYTAYTCKFQDTNHCPEKQFFDRKMPVLDDSLQRRDEASAITLTSMVRKGSCTKDKSYLPFTRKLHDSIHTVKTFVFVKVFNEHGIPKAKMTAYTNQDSNKGKKQYTDMLQYCDPKGDSSAETTTETVFELNKCVVLNEDADMRYTYVRAEIEKVGVIRIERYINALGCYNRETRYMKLHFYYLNRCSPKDPLNVSNRLTYSIKDVPGRDILLKQKFGAYDLTCSQPDEAPTLDTPLTVCKEGTTWIRSSGSGVLAVQFKTQEECYRYRKSDALISQWTYIPDKICGQQIETNANGAIHVSQYTVRTTEFHFELPPDFVLADSDSKGMPIPAFVVGQLLQSMYNTEGELFRVASESEKPCERIEGISKYSVYNPVSGVEFECPCTLWKKTDPTNDKTCDPDCFGSGWESEIIGAFEKKDNQEDKGYSYSCTMKASKMDYYEDKPVGPEKQGHHLIFSATQPASPELYYRIQTVPTESSLNIVKYDQKWYDQCTKKLAERTADKHNNVPVIDKDESTSDKKDLDNDLPMAETIDDIPPGDVPETALLTLYKCMPKGGIEFDDPRSHPEAIDKELNDPEAAQKSKELAKKVCYMFRNAADLGAGNTGLVIEKYESCEKCAVVEDKSDLAEATASAQTNGDARLKPKPESSATLMLDVCIPNFIHTVSADETYAILFNTFVGDQKEDIESGYRVTKTPVEYVDETLLNAAINVGKEDYRTQVLEYGDTMKSLHFKQTMAQQKDAALNKLVSAGKTPVPDDTEQNDDIGDADEA